MTTVIILYVLFRLIVRNVPRQTIKGTADL